MIEAFLTGLAAKVNATDEEEAHNDFYNAVGGRFFDARSYQYTDTDYESETYPYSDVDIISAVPSWDYSTDYEEIIFQINLYAETSTSIDDVFAKWTALVEPDPGDPWVTLTITGYTQISLKRNFAERGIDEDDKWYYVIQYTLLMENA